MRAAGTALLADVSEYLRYEAAATPVADDVERFAHAVDAIFATTSSVSRRESRGWNGDRRKGRDRAPSRF